MALRTLAHAAETTPARARAHTRGRRGGGTPQEINRVLSPGRARQCSHQGRAAPATAAGGRSGGQRPGTSWSLRDPTFA